MAWIKSQDVLQEFKSSYRSGNFEHCILLLDRFQDDEIPYLSEALARKIARYAVETSSQNQLYGFCKIAGERSRKVFAQNILQELTYEIDQLFKRKGSKPITHLTQAAHEIFIPITHDFLAGDLYPLARLLSVLADYDNLGVRSDEESDRLLELKEQTLAKGLPTWGSELWNPASGSRVSKKFLYKQAADSERRIQLKEFLDK